MLTNILLKLPRYLSLTQKPPIRNSIFVEYIYYYPWFKKFVYVALSDKMFFIMTVENNKIDAYFRAG